MPEKKSQKKKENPSVRKPSRDGALRELTWAVAMKPSRLRVLEEGERGVGFARNDTLVDFSGVDGHLAIVEGQKVRSDEDEGLRGIWHCEVVFDELC